MTKVVTLARAAAPITLASRCAAPTPSVQDTTVPTLHAQAESALAAALELLRQPASAADLQRATGRACRAATLMKRLSAAQAEGGAA